MTRHRYREISLDVPDDWQDRSFLAFSAPARPDNTSQPSVVVTRDELPSGMTARTFAAKELAARAAGLPEFELEDSREIVVAGQEGVEMRFKWKGDPATMAQRQVVVAMGGVVYTITQSGAPNEMAAAMPEFDAMLQSLRFGPGAAAETSVPAPAPAREAPAPPPPVFRKNPF